MNNLCKMDGGKTMDEITTACDESGMAYLFRAEGETAQHIVDLLDADKQGLLVRLPCKVGDTIYRTYEGDIFDWTIDSIVVFQAETILVDDSENYISPDDIGKTEFLTLEEAEAALKERAEQ